MPMRLGKSPPYYNSNKRKSNVRQPPENPTALLKSQEVTLQLSRGTNNENTKESESKLSDGLLASGTDEFAAFATESAPDVAAGCEQGRCARLGSHHLNECHPGCRSTRHCGTSTGRAVRHRHQAGQSRWKGSLKALVPGSEQGAAVVDFVLVSALVTVMFLALIQLTLVLHVRNTVADAASSAARYGALADRTPADAKNRAESLLSSSLGAKYAQNVQASQTSSGGVAMLTVTVTTPLPLLGLIGLGGELSMSGHAIVP